MMSTLRQIGRLLVALAGDWYTAKHLSKGSKPLEWKCCISSDRLESDRMSEMMSTIRPVRVVKGRKRLIGHGTGAPAFLSRSTT